MLRMSKKSELEQALQSPIPFRTGCNGEFIPKPVTERDTKAEALFMRLADQRARRMGISRRDFVESAAGSATALLVINSVYGCSDAGSLDGGRSDVGGARDAGQADLGAGDGGVYDVDAGMTEDAGMACEALSGDEFIFDVQTHHVNPEGDWRTSNPGWEFFLRSLPQGACGERDGVDCFTRRNYIREMFLNSETTMAVLSAVPADAGENPLEVQEANETRRIMDEVSDSQRLVLHGLVLPDLGQAQLDGMQRLVEEEGVAAWKVYTPFQPSGSSGGWRLDDETVGIPFIERARSLGVKRICAHKGLPLVGFDPAFASPDDIGVVAAAYPDVDFIVYHSGYETQTTEGPYNPMNPQGVDRLIKSMEDNGVGRNSNVYAELGSVWRSVMLSPNEAAHVLGKLIRYVGEDRVLWGTDSIWYGSPQDQIMAFRAFSITEKFQQMFGYPALTPQIKAKIFGLNAAQVYGVDPQAIRCAVDEDELTRLTMNLESPLPKFRRYGPQTRREFFAFLKSRGGAPG